MTVLEQKKSDKDFHATTSMVRDLSPIDFLNTPVTFREGARNQLRKRISTLSQPPDLSRVVSKVECHQEFYVSPSQQKQQ